MQKFISDIQTTIIGTLDKEGLPFSSYAPYIYDNNRFYIYISNIATHTKNIEANPHASLLFIEDESRSENLFARKRISLQCTSVQIPRKSARFKAVMKLFERKFDSSMIAMLQKMTDFNLFELEVKAGEATFGFGKAYLIGGEDMNELVSRHGGGHQQEE
ncbi:MAG: heme iron utilization protein [Epsilonproteobacteria bacterium]|nr:heme iron utilization protein [Campylobacterota bacterium]OIO14753.1 MAG: heme iron utilization protein [Helicobacteraceae bacterium CG1_02_36_14]PIP09194.1 MAG: heme iron utilization protein [Sulfurimonas sp. CG23_combo_of_CG06-09_8_20_14_all_36_33]PIS25122.1 MAG: heme iron utilization protein [Sulfurimonas sp. CG08_land_8_20_14_0_20_36_33]PIU34625.1 MAG: heme iron utilization protein [Sulfurimonas sp. CG07_land_8_20_14_0_80_36_56]PIV04454.1 MAG: heme iron utilization protein [Sulfurimonas